MARRRRSRTALILLLAGGLLVAAEGAVRLRQMLRYGTASGSLHVLVDDPASGLKIPRSGIVEGGQHRIEIDSHGFRNPELELPKPAGRRRVAFLGGSTTFCAEASDNARTWPERVGRGLAEAFPGVDLDFVNAGVGGYSIAQSLVNLEVRVAPTDPDVIVIYHATNDMSSGTRTLAEAAGLIAAGEQDPSWLAGHSLAWNLVEKNWRAWRRGGGGGTQGATLDDDPTPHAEAFRARLTGLVRAAQRQAPVVVLVTFAHKARRDQDPAAQRAACASSLYYMPYMSIEGLLAGFEAYNAVIRQVAADTGALLVEGEGRIPGDDEHFADSVHLTDAGCALQAERVLDVLTRSPQVARALGAGGTAADG